MALTVAMVQKYLGKFFGLKGLILHYGTELLENSSRLYPDSATSLAYMVSGTIYAKLSSAGLAVDNIPEYTAGAGVTIDGMLIKDGSIKGLQTVASGAAAITTTRALTLADSGGVFSVAQSSAYDIDLPSPTSGPGCRYLFYLTAPGAFNVTITVAGAAATFVGTIANDVTSVVPATGATLTFATGTAVLGDTIEITSISTGLYHVRAITSAAGGITIA